MKYKLLGLIAFAAVLGTSCKKETQEPEAIKFVKPMTKSDVGGYPDNEFTFPHNTGTCNCGKFPKCHPVAQTTHEENCDPCQVYPPK